MNKLKVLLRPIKKRQIIFMLAFSIVLAIGVTTLQYLVDANYKYMTLTLNYSGSERGLNPDGSRFNISEIKSEEVLSLAIEALGDTNLTAEHLSKRIHVDSKMPPSAVESTATSIASGSSYSYAPAEFTIYYSQKDKLSPHMAAEVLRKIASAYNAVFHEKYAEKNNILKNIDMSDYAGYDYPELAQILRDRVDSMIIYLSHHMGENNAFRSRKTGCTFENLVSMLRNLKDVDLEKFEAYVIQNQVSKDSEAFSRKKQYQRDEEALRYEKNRQASEIIKNALLIYDPNMTGVAFIPTVDDTNSYYMSRTKTGLDDLAVKSHNLGVDASLFKDRIDQHERLLDLFDNAPAATDIETATADKMLEGIERYLRRIASTAMVTDNEYLEGKTKNYLSFILPTDENPIRVNQFVKTAIFGFFLALLILLFRMHVLDVLLNRWYYIKRRSRRRAITRKKRARAEKDATYKRKRS